MHTCLASVLVVLSISRAGPQAPLPADDDAPSPSLPGAVPLANPAPARHAGRTSSVRQATRPDRLPSAPSITAPAKKSVLTARIATSKSACGHSQCESTAFVRYRGHAKGAGRDVAQQPVVNPAVCAVFWAWDYVPLPYDAWASCCFNPKTDCSRGEIKPRLNGAKLVPRYGQKWLLKGKRVDALQDCMRRCDITPGCRGGTFVGRDSACWLVPSIGKVQEPCLPRDRCSAFEKDAAEGAARAAAAELAALHMSPDTTASTSAAIGAGGRGRRGRHEHEEGPARVRLSTVLDVEASLVRVFIAADDRVSLLHFQLLRRSKRGNARGSTTGALGALSTGTTNTALVGARERLDMGGVAVSASGFELHHNRQRGTFVLASIADGMRGQKPSFIAASKTPRLLLTVQIPANVSATAAAAATKICIAHAWAANGAGSALRVRGGCATAIDDDAKSNATQAGGSAGRAGLPLASESQQLRLGIGLRGITKHAFLRGGFGVSRLRAALVHLCGAQRGAVEIEPAVATGSKGIGIVATVNQAEVEGVDDASPLNDIMTRVLDPDFMTALTARLSSGADVALARDFNTAADIAEGNLLVARQVMSDKRATHGGQHDLYGPENQNPFHHSRGFVRAELRGVRVQSVKPESCELSVWTSWSKCTKTCGGGGAQRRTRSIVRLPQLGAPACGALSEKRFCQDKDPSLFSPCPVPCKLSPPTDCTPCSHGCGGGERECLVEVLAAPKYGGFPCPQPTLNDYYIMMGKRALNKVNVQQRCNEQPCPVDCIVRNSPWSACSVTCDEGVQTRKQNVVRAPAHGGKACVKAQLKRRCMGGGGRCPRPCRVGMWGLWGPCTPSCGTISVRTRVRSILADPVGAGHPCPATRQQASCSGLPVCNTDCVLAAPKCRGGCSVTCGRGTFAVCTRAIITPASGTGRACPSASSPSRLLEHNVTCSHAPCPVDCVVSEWSALSPCTQSCLPSTNASAGTHAKAAAGGVRTRVRRVLNGGAKHGGRSCPALRQQHTCGRIPCPVDCTATPWACGACSVTCGQGHTRCTRAALTAPRFGGRKCSTSRHSVCSGGAPCAQDCVLARWGHWGKCSKSCGLGGVQRRDRKVRRHAANLGKPCPSTRQTRYCPWMGECPVDCVASAWPAWSVCSHTCGGGRRTRSRWVVSQAAFGGRKCPALSQRAVCATQRCPVDCKVAAGWQCDRSQCAPHCSGGSMQCTRRVLRQPVAGGRRCPIVNKVVGCTKRTCAVPCVVGQWGSWSTCSKTCGGGRSLRARQPVTWPSGGGRKCPWLAETRKCNTAPCPVDCSVSPWLPWGACSQTCGDGTRQRVRRITRHPAHGGAVCPALSQTSRGCASSGGQKQKPCPISNRALHNRLAATFCSMTAWGGWSGCTRSCGGGRAGRLRRPQAASTAAAKLLASLGYSHKDVSKVLGCPASRQDRACNTQPCPAPAPAPCRDAYVRCKAWRDKHGRVHLRLVKAMPRAMFKGRPAPDYSRFHCYRVHTPAGKPPECRCVCTEGPTRLAMALGTHGAHTRLEGNKGG